MVHFGTDNRPEIPNQFFERISVENIREERNRYEFEKFARFKYFCEIQVVLQV